MFFTYLFRELRRRQKQAFIVALGLGIGIGLVITVSAASSGVKSAQTKVLHSLYGVGTDMTVTQTASAPTGGPVHFGFSPGSGGTTPQAGQPFSRNRLRPAFGTATMPESRVTTINHLNDVEAAVGGLSLNDTNVSGTFGSFSGGSSGFAPGGSSSGGSAPNLNVNSFTVQGVQPTGTGVGPLSPSDISSGRYFTSGENTDHVAIVSSSYAEQNSLKVDSTTKIDQTSFKVIGIANFPSSSSPSDVFIPLGTAQKLAGLQNKVTTIYVSAASASDVSSIQSNVQHLYPKATVTTSASLAKEVSGSLTSASSLATSLGKWLSIAALLVAFLLAGLLMMAAVSRRVREFGTLKAIGWRTKRVVGQVMGEGVAQGVIGGIVGVILGLIGAGLIELISPTLTATVGASAVTGGGAGGFPTGGFAGGGGGFPGGGAGGFGGARSFANRTGGGGGFANRFANLTHTVLVHMGAPIQGGSLILAVGLAILGGLIAGALGSWRAARLRPADALRSVG